MARKISECDRRPAKGGRGEVTKWICHVDVGASGAPTVSAAKSDPDWTWTRASAGLYDITFPPGVRGHVKPLLLKSATPTVFFGVCLAQDVTAGTAQIRYCNIAGAATDPASGDIIGAELVAAGFSG